MSQKASRKSQNATAVSEEKEKRQTDSPAKEMKKKIAANAEKEKQVADKPEKPAEKTSKPAEKSEKPVEKTSKPAEKSVEKTSKPAEKSEKPADKPTEKPKNVEKQDSKNEKDKPVEKKQDKADKKPEKPLEKPAEKKEDNKVDKNAKDKPSKLNGHNGSEANGNEHTVSDDSSDDLVIEEDEVFPELTYDESDTDAFEADASRSLTRRSQVKVTKTPETPRPTSDKDNDDSKESKVLKLSDTPTSDRKLRSADSPKPESKKNDAQKKDGQEETSDSTKKDQDGAKNKGDKNVDKDVEIIEIDCNEADSRSNKCRARVSPYTRNKHDVTVSSVAANYTGNNTTMEMDITETSILEESPDDSGYLRGLKNIRGRSSYKVLGDMPVRRTPRQVLVSAVTISESRPTGCVVGRKRKPSTEHIVELASEATPDLFTHSLTKRMKLLDRLAMPFRKGAVNRRNAEIVGINTDLPLTAPVASPLDPETIKPTIDIHSEIPLTPLPTPDKDGKRCVVM